MPAEVDDTGIRNRRLEPPPSPNCLGAVVKMRKDPPIPFREAPKELECGHCVIVEVYALLVAVLAAWDWAFPRTRLRSKRQERYPPSPEEAIPVEILLQC